MSTPFDFDAFIKGTNLARRDVHAYRVDHRDEIGRLEAEHDALPEEDADERESSDGSDREAIAQRIAELRRDMRDSRVTITLRTLTVEEFAALGDDDGDGLPEDPDDDTAEQAKERARRRFDAVLEQLALQSQPPKDCPDPSKYADLPNLTVEQWRQIANALDVYQWGQMVEQATALVLSRVAVPDFSPSVSETLKPKVSSES